MIMNNRVVDQVFLVIQHLIKDQHSQDFYRSLQLSLTDSQVRLRTASHTHHCYYVQAMFHVKLIKEICLFVPISRNDFC